MFAHRVEFLKRNSYLILQLSSFIVPQNKFEWRHIERYGFTPSRLQNQPPNLDFIQHI